MRKGIKTGGREELGNATYKYKTTFEELREVMICGVDIMDIMNGGGEEEVVAEKRRRW